MSRRRAAVVVGLALPGLLWGCGEWLALRGCAPRREIPEVEPALFSLPSPPPPPPLEEVLDESFQVVSVDGEVERRRASGPWLRVAAGDELRADEAVRTQPRSRAVLGSKDVGTVEIAQRSEFTVKEISRTVAKFRLEQGRMFAELAEGGRSVRVEDRSGGVSAQASAGKFVVMSQGDRHMVVGVSAGAALLSVGASSVVVNAGEQSETWDGGVPSAPHAIPRSLFLKVVRPPAAVQRAMHAKIRGETTPGTIVSVNGLSPVAADQAGTFEADVPLREGKNELLLEAEDLYGRSKSLKLPPIRVKRKVDVRKTEVRWPRGDE